MSDAFVEYQKKDKDLREEMVNEILDILHSKGYDTGEIAYAPGSEKTFELCYDRLLINESHSDSLSTGELLQNIISAMHVSSINNKTRGGSSFLPSD